MDTTTKTAVVAGGTGGIGEGVVQAFLSAGYCVYVPVREKDPSERLKAFVHNPAGLRFLPADLGDDLAVLAMRDRILEEVPQIDAVVVSVGAGYWGYRLHKMPRTDWDDSIQDNLATHFNVQRVFIDQLRRQNSGTFITLVGPEAEHIRPDAGMVSIMAAAQKMMTRVLAEESSDTSVRVHAVTVHTTIHTRSRGENTNREWITARDLGEYVAALVAERVPGCDRALHDLKDHWQLQSILHPG